jgi:hypothetical protein
LDGSEVKEVIAGLNQPRAMALDTVGRKIYWIEVGSNKIRRADLDGAGIEDLVIVGVDLALGIALDLSSGKMYWTNWTYPRKIQRANLDGSEVEDIIEEGVVGPWGITILPSLDPVPLRILSPNGGEVMVAGDTFPIRWESSEQITEVLVEYSIDNGMSWMPVDPPNFGNTGSYNWVIPYFHSYQCRVRTSDINDPNISDSSYSLFKIVIPTQRLVPVEYPTVQAAIDAANKGDTIIVADGSYIGPGNRDINFNGKAIKVRSENGPENCIIDCENLGRGFLFQSGEDQNSILEGFTIKRGNTTNGAGIQCLYRSSPVISNCVLVGNVSSRYGGAVSCSMSNPTFVNCVFERNSGRNGGGMRNYKSSPDLISCVFIGNTCPSGSGGAMYNTDESCPNLVDCNFVGNSAKWTGGIFSIYECAPLLRNCTFIGNSTTYTSAAMNNRSNSDAELIGCTFMNNPGVAVHNTFSDARLVECTFIGNLIGVSNSDSNSIAIRCVFMENGPSSGGGGAYNIHSKPVFIGCEFIRNWTDGTGGGGGIHNAWSNAIIVDCLFEGNRAYRYYYGCGGGIRNVESSPVIRGCSFIDNYAQEDGGAMWSYQFSNPLLKNCLLVGNSAEDAGGGIYSEQTELVVLSCTFTGNSSGRGKAFACDSSSHLRPSSLRVTDCIMWETAQTVGNYDNSEITITFSDVRDGWPGEGNIDADPCFVEPGYWDANGVWFDGDYHLLPDSPCIDAGEQNYIAEPNEKDLDGKPRIIGCQIDMGAYEYGQLISAEVRIIPRTINLASKGKWLSCSISLPEDYNVADIDSDSILLECEIEPEYLHVDELAQLATARFNRQDVQPILEVGDINLKISCQLTDGTVFEATDVIRVIDKGNKK